MYTRTLQTLVTKRYKIKRSKKRKKEIKNNLGYLTLKKMTCIVGFIDKKKNKVVMGADSVGIAGLEVTLRKDKKVFKNGDFVIGGTSSFRMIQLLRFSFRPPEIHDKEIYEYMCTDFINAVRKCFEEGGCLQKFSDGDEKGGVFLVAYKDRLFKIDNDFQVAEASQGFDACGCGEAYALGSIYSTSKTNAETIVIDALRCAENFSGGVRSPFVIYCTQKKLTITLDI